MAARSAIGKPAVKPTTPMQSAVHWALLGLVIERPSYGYELAHRFEHAYAGMLRLSGVSYVYTALDTLQRRGMIEETPGTRSGRQPRPRYRATPEGVDGYKEHLIAQIGEDFRRSRLFARQLAAFAHDPDLALEIIERYGQACLQEAGDAPLPAVGDEGLDQVSGLASRLVCEDGRLTMEAKLPWVEYARSQFKALAGDRLARR
ncbi:MAG TPA: helix-turn-helix transcriptional regulator [Solirubrobacteraceae bacterium]|nr:helix-turn-helix transcriptional regulator [Solirubrobacteraceae bacterium]